MNITHKTYKDLHALILLDSPKTLVSSLADTERKTRVHGCAHTWTLQTFGNAKAKQHLK